MTDTERIVMFNGIEYNFADCGAKTTPNDTVAKSDEYKSLFDSSNMQDVNLNKNPFDVVRQNNAPSNVVNDGSKYMWYEPFEEGLLYSEVQNGSNTKMTYADFDNDGSIDMIAETTSNTSIFSNDGVFTTKEHLLTPQDKVDLKNSIDNNIPYSPRTDSVLVSVLNGNDKKGYQDTDNNGILDIYREISENPDDGSKTETKIKYNNDADFNAPNYLVQNTYDADGKETSIYREEYHEHELSYEKDILYYDLVAGMTTCFTNTYDIDGILRSSAGYTATSDGKLVEDYSMQREDAPDYSRSITEIYKFSRNFYNDGSLKQPEIGSFKAKNGRPFYEYQ